MKHILLGISLSALMACNLNDAKTLAFPNNAIITENKSADYLSTNPNYKPGFAAIKKTDCLSCHAVNEKKIGPSFKEIAVKYTSYDARIVDTLTSKVLKGGAGVWGKVPMICHPLLKPEDARAMVKYILLQKAL